MAIPKPVFEFIEQELFDFDLAKARLNNAPEKIKHSLTVIATAERLCLIEEAINELPDQHRQFYELYYRQGKKLQEVMAKMYLSRTTAYRLRREIVAFVGLKLGVVREWDK